MKNSCNRNNYAISCCSIHFCGNIMSLTLNHVQKFIFKNYAFNDFFIAIKKSRLKAVRKNNNFSRFIVRLWVIRIHS